MKIFATSNCNTVYADTSTENSRGHRAKLISFYCPYCDVVHVDYNYHDNNFYNLDGSMFCYRVEGLLEED